MKQIISDTKDINGEVIRTRHLFGFLNRKLAIGISIVFFNQFTGINTIIFYNEAIFEPDYALDDLPYMLVLSPVLVLGTICCIILIEKYGRKNLLIIGYSI